MLGENWPQTHSETYREAEAERNPDLPPPTRDGPPIGTGMGECMRGPLSLKSHSFHRWGPQEGLPGVRATRLGIHRSEDGRSSQDL